MIPPTSPRLSKPCSFSGPNLKKGSPDAPEALVILDGLGIPQDASAQVLLEQSMPHFFNYFSSYPHAILTAHGESVGLLPDMIGNSAVGHTTIGAGTVIDQPVKVLYESIKNGSFFKNPLLKSHLTKLKNNGDALHIIGLLSDAGVHCHTAIIKACIEYAQQIGVKKIVIHPILDGRDVPPRSAAHYLQDLESSLNKIKNYKGRVVIGTIQGRFYAMDRNNNNARTTAAYTILTTNGSTKNDWQTVLKEYYAKGITDEFIPPTHLTPDSAIQPGDGIIFCNIRADRARQLTQLLLTLDTAFVITGIPYFEKGTALYTPTVLDNTLLDILAAQGKTIFTCAESEKYAHISYFFKGGKETLLPTETQVIVHSHSPKTFVSDPQMCAPAITHAVLHSLQTNPCDFYLINYANPDMVGHTGNRAATIKALQCVDEQLTLLYNEIVIRKKGTLYITSDHGKAEQLWDTTSNQACTAHTKNPIPFVMMRTGLNSTPLPLHTLADIAPFILQTQDIA